MRVKVPELIQMMSPNDRTQSYPALRQSVVDPDSLIGCVKGISDFVGGLTSPSVSYQFHRSSQNPLPFLQDAHMGAPISGNAVTTRRAPHRMRQWFRPFRAA